jgi:DNA-binding NtrC family response regulator
MTCKVLVVDDDEDIRDSMVDFLTHEGYLALGMKNGQQALSHLTWSALPDFVLLDLHMPGMNGAELLAKLLENPRWWAIPIVICSGDSVPKELKTQVFGVLQKPFDLERLVDIVKKACESKR